MVSDFFKSILPPEGLGFRVAAVFVDGLKSPPRHKFFERDADLIATSARCSIAGLNYYHACASYTEKTSRKGTNVAAIKSLWIDLDVGLGKPYAKQSEAALAYEQFRTAVGLPVSWVVSSGNGVHIYQPFTKAILPEQWDRLSAMFAACLDHYGVKHDTSRTQDKASILRTPGTSNYKTSPGKNVVIKRAGIETPAKHLWDTLKAYADANGVFVAPPSKAKVRETNDLIGAPKDYPPSLGDRITTHCAVLKDVAESGGDTSYDIWWRAMGVAKHTQDSATVATHWTRNRAATGHDKADPTAGMASWNVGPTTCSEFSSHTDKCRGCPHFGKITSPIQLGVDEQPPVRTFTLHTQLAEGEDGDATVEITAPTMPSEMGYKTEKVVNDRCRGTYTGIDAAGRMTRSVKDGESDDGTPIFKHVPFCDRYWQVTRRIKDVDHKWKLEITYDTYPGRPPSTFLFDSASVLVPDSIRKEFSAREIHIYGGKTAMEKASNLMMFDQELLRGYQQESLTYPTMGWVTQDNNPTGPITGEFIIGNTKYVKGQPPSEVLLTESATDKFGGSFLTAGSTAEWVRLVDEIYNRKGAEAYQFIIASMFASPLVKLTPGGGEWHGIPIGVGGDSGAAKTTTALVALSMYTNGQALKFNASQQQGDTINALAIKVGMLRNVPCMIDELTNADVDKVSSILFMMANGQPKDRATQNSTLVANPYRWDMTSIISTNNDLHDLLETSHTKDAQEAGKLRLFQISLRKDDLRTIFPDVTKSKVEHDLLGCNYGMVGREWIQFLVNNVTKIQAMLAKARAAYVPINDEGTETRFYRDLILVTYVAATLAKQRGFIHWDVEAMRSWAEGQLTKLRLGIGSSSWEADISDLVASLNGRTIVTRHFKEGRGRRHHREIPLATMASNVIPVARKALDDGRFFVVDSYVREWCKLKRVVYKQIVEEMAARGFIRIGPDGKPLMTGVNIGSGTDVSRPRAPCLEFDYNLIAELEAEDTPAAANVVAFPAPEQVVAQPVAQPESAMETEAANP